MSKTKQNSGSAPGIIQQTVMAFQKSRILLTAFELGIFTFLSGKGKTAAETAAALEINPGGAERLMNALCALDLLEKKDNVFGNTPEAEKFLVKGSPFFMGGIGHWVHLWDTWSTLTPAVRKGKTVIDRDINDRGDEWLTAFIESMHRRAKQTAPADVAKLDLKNVSRVLDIGGGSGVYAMAFARAKDGMEAVVFDLPNVTPLTRSYIEKEGLSGKITTLSGNYHVDDFGSGYDLIFISAVVHINSPEENIRLLTRCARALNPGGQVVVMDFIMAEDRTSPARGAIFSLNMLVGTEAGDTYTESEVKSWLQKAGLPVTERIDVSPDAAMIVGRA